MDDDARHDGAAGPVRAEFSTSDPQLAHAWIRSSYTEYDTRHNDEAVDFRFLDQQTDFGRYTLSRLKFPAIADLTVPDMQVMFVAQVFTGGTGSPPAIDR